MEDVIDETAEAPAEEEAADTKDTEDCDTEISEDICPEKYERTGVYMTDGTDSSDTVLRRAFGLE